MKLLSYQPFSLYANGGGNRILRRLYQGRETHVVSLAVEQVKSLPAHGAVPETVVYAGPTVQQWARWHVRTFITFLRHKIFKRYTTKQIQEAASKIGYDILHVVDHGPFSDALCDVVKNSKREMWVSFHDHFSTTFGSFEASFKLWANASRRLVISAELGREYQKLFGNKPFELITDGVNADEIGSDKVDGAAIKQVYFAGLLHIDYLPLFAILADALDKLSKEGHQFNLVLRGTQYIQFLENRSFNVEYRPMTIDDAQLKKELDESAVLYLPIKFTKPDFYLYSLSTKMVGYLGAPGAILYHGPANSAAANLLEKNDAAICNFGLDAAELSADIITLVNRQEALSVNAKQLARAQFNLSDIQKKFWQTNTLK